MSQIRRAPALTKTVGGGAVKTNLTRLTLLLALTSAYVLVALAPAIAAG